MGSSFLRNLGSKERWLFLSMKKLVPRPRRIFYLILLSGFLAIGAYTASSLHNQASAATCTPTGFIRDNINLTAATIVTTSSTIANATINATGCNIGIYFAPGSSGSVINSEIYGANYFGVVNNSGRVTVTRSRIHNIGENPFNGTQHGRAIQFVASGSGSIAGSITLNQISAYQKNGIDIRGKTSSVIPVYNNTVIGQGPVDYIAQNGIVIGSGAQASVTNNTVQGNSYTGAGQTSSGGILVFGGSCYGVPLTTGTYISGNTVVGNDVGVFLSNLDSSCQPTTTPTRISVSNNTIRNDNINNTTGAQFDGQFYGYQAGISDQGDLDSMIGNRICGLGYTPVIPPPFLYVIDITNTNTPTVSNNTSCQTSSTNSSTPVTSSQHPQQVQIHMRPAVD
jgi:hypothetical protein